MRIIDLIKKFHVWAKTHVIDEYRKLNEEIGYYWVYKDIKYDLPLQIHNYQDFFDRTELNEEYARRYNEEDISKKKQFAYYGAEISMIASFHKCFAIRNQTRLQYYRNDMATKGKRAFSSVNIGVGKHLYLFDQADK